MDLRTVNNLDAFLWAFFPDDTETIHFRSFKPKDAASTKHNKPQKIQLTRKEINEYGWLGLNEINQHSGLYFIPNAGGDTDKDITRFNAVFVENDTLPIDEQHEALNKATIPPSLRIETKKSVHAYWLLNNKWMTVSEWRDLQLRLIAHFDGDVSIKNPSRVMRVPYFDHISVKGTKTIRQRVQLVDFQPARRFYANQLRQAFPVVGDSEMPADAHITNDNIPRLRPQIEITDVIKGGKRNTTLFSLAGSLRRKGLSSNEILTLLVSVNETRVRPMLPIDELERIADGSMRYEPEKK